MSQYPDLTLLNSYLKGYVSMVPSNLDLISALDYSHLELLGVLNTITEDKSMYKYQPEKWSIKTLVMHLTDTERVFQYRALSIARGEIRDHLSFDENVFAANSFADELNFEQIVLEYSLVADSIRTLFENMNSDRFQVIGSANGMQLSPAIIGFITAGHRLHHLAILKDRYKV